MLTFILYYLFIYLIYSRGRINLDAKGQAAVFEEWLNFNYLLKKKKK